MSGSPSDPSFRVWRRELRKEKAIDNIVYGVLGFCGIVAIIFMLVGH